MAKPSIETLAARLDVQAIALQEMARVLSAPQAEAVAAAARARLAGLADEGTPGAVDAAIAGELVQLLDALGPP